MHAAPPFDQAPIPYVGGPMRAFVYAVHDGDTMWVDCDLPFGVHHSNPEKGIRLVGPNAKGFNTPELNAPDAATVTAAKAARDRVIQLVQGKFVYVESWPPTQDDKYGRWLMAVYVPMYEQTFPPNTALPMSLPNGVACFDLASQLVLEGLGVWEKF